jgi:hypothetical protein
MVGVQEGTQLAFVAAGGDAAAFDALFRCERRGGGPLSDR